MVSFFTNYLTAFITYDLTEVVGCYHLPCTLHTPDKAVLLTDITMCKQEFSDIFAQLQQAKTSDIIARKSSYSIVTNDLVLVCINWDFIDDQGEVFADFCAIYHLACIKTKWGIISVTSHDLSNAIVLAHPFDIEQR